MTKDFDELREINELVQRIDELRVERGFSIYELALKSGTSINTIKYLYKKQSFPNIRTIYNICEAFEIPVWMLFFKADNRLYLSKSEILLIDNYEKLSDIGKRLLLEISSNLK